MEVAFPPPSSIGFVHRVIGLGIGVVGTDLCCGTVYSHVFVREGERERERAPRTQIHKEEQKGRENESDRQTEREHK